jgi:hypothetical protein
VPDSSHGDRRVLQVFFAPMASPKPDELVQLRHLAVLASGLPNIEIIRKGGNLMVAAADDDLAVWSDGCDVVSDL